MIARQISREFVKIFRNAHINPKAHWSLLRYGWWRSSRWFCWAWEFLSTRTATSRHSVLFSVYRIVANWYLRWCNTYHFLIRLWIHG